MKFKAMVDNKVIKNHISLATIKQLGLPHKQKEEPYPLVMILGDLIIYKDKMIYLKIGPIELELEGKHIIMSFNVLPLGKDKAVLKKLFL